MTKPEPVEPEPPANPAYLPAEPALPPDTPRQRRIGFGVVLAVLLSGITYFVWDHATSTPESVVADYFDAIIAKDVDLALSYVTDEGMAEPEADVFLDPKAIADGWELVDTEQDLDDPLSDTVKVTLGNGGETQTGHVQVQQVDDEWRVDDPFVMVTIAPGPLTYLQVNDKVVDLEQLHASDITGLTRTEYRLFPGLNTFFGDVKASSGEAGPAKLMFPPKEISSDAVPVGPPDLTFTSKALGQMQESVNEHIDDCAEFKVRQPLACPFGVEATYDADEDHSYTGLRDITWSVNAYPKVTVAKPDSGDDALGAPIGWEDPGEIALSATASTDDDSSVKLKAKCPFSTEGMRVGFAPDGKPRVYSPPLDGIVTVWTTYPLDTCEAEPGQDEG